MRARVLGCGVAALALALSGCSGGEEAATGTPTPTTSESPSASAASPVTLPRAREPRGPQEGSCYALTYEEAVAPTIGRRPTACDKPHTALTFSTGRLSTVVDGHLLAVDADRVRAQPAAQCPEALSGFVGGDRRDLRLSMLRTVWFTPTVAQSDAGAEWYRCDVIAVGAEDELADLGPDLQGVLGRDEGAQSYGMCGTAAPDDADFRRVVCSRDHTWRAIEVVDLGTGDYPGADAARAAGQTPCEDAGRDVADDALDFEWGYEWPSAEQWGAGQTFGRCWAPDPG